MARQYAADPEAADYAPDPLPASLYNANIANQSKLDVVVNSWNYTDDNDYSDDDGVAASPADVDPGDPCFVHTAGDNISPGGGQWTDVRVKENDLPSLFGAIGLPLKRNVARARIEIRPALSQKGFLPLAVPNTIVTKVQVRYYDECRDPSHTAPLLTRDLYPVPNDNTNANSGLRRDRGRHALGACQRHPAAAGPAGGRHDPRSSRSPSRATTRAAATISPSACRCGSRAATGSTSTSRARR